MSACASDRRLLFRTPRTRFRQPRSRARGRHGSGSINTMAICPLAWYVPQLGEGDPGSRVGRAAVGGCGPTAFPEERSSSRC